jgi:lipopolysaccharide O-acetyltransferase
MSKRPPEPVRSVSDACEERAYDLRVAGVKCIFGRLFLGGYRFSRRARAKLFSLIAGQAFASFGSRSVIQPPLRLSGERHIAIGRGVFLGSGCWLQVLEDAAPEGVVLSIGDGTSIVGSCVISAALSIRIEEKVLIARNVYISDHSHAFADATRAVLDQGIENVRGVEIGRGAWLGENVVVCPGVRIGRGAVIGANAVVRTDVPDYSVAVGVPASVVRVFSGEEHDGRERADVSGAV